MDRCAGQTPLDVRQRCRSRNTAVIVRHQFQPTILREYDIRGVVGETLTTGDAYAVGRAFGTIVRRSGGKTACVGYDGRLTSPELEAAVVQGLRECGIAVWRVGLGPTPMLYFATIMLAADAGLMVTGSHNPPNHNGFKMMLGRAALYGPAIQELGLIAAAGAYADGPVGDVVERLVFDSYVDRLVAGLADAGHIGRPLTIAWDAGNGATGRVMAALTRRLPGRHLLLNEAIDGTFPAHHPDPTIEENLQQLRAEVVGSTCDFGVAFDGDGDRLGVVDDSGCSVWADHLMIFFAREVLETKPGVTIIGDVKCSQVLFDEIARAGGRPLMWRTGHSLIKSKMAETGSPLAGEMSGHIFFGEPYLGYDDALYAAIRLVGIVGRSGQALSEMRQSWPVVFSTPEIRLAVSDTLKFAVIEEVRRLMHREGANVNEIDGVRVLTADGWWLLRASNTQAVLIARCEARDSAGLERLKRTMSRVLEEVGQESPIW